MNLSFHSMILLAYTVPNIYVFLRIWNLFIGKGHRLTYVLVYLSFISIYPLSGLFGGVTGTILYDISNYLLPFFLNLFLLILFYDVFLLVNLFIRVLPSEKRKSYKLRRNTLASIIVLSALVVLAGAINFLTIRTTEYTVTVNGKSSQLNELRLAYAADFHIDSQTSVSFIRRFSEKIEEISPDILLYGGDIVEGHDGEKMEQQEELLCKIRTKYGSYGVLGNHEYYRGQDRGSFFDKAGITVLRDTVIAFGNAFSLAGRLDSHFQYRKSAAEIVEMAADSLPVILLDHRPTELIEVSKTRADIQLSGHTHDGQMFPINLITRKVYLLSKGYRKIGNTHFFVTSGIRQWRFPVRTTGKSEIIVLNINFLK